MSALDVECPTCRAAVGEKCKSAGITHGKRRRAADPDVARTEMAEADARRALRRAAVAYAEVAGDEDDNAWTAAWTGLREAALSYATATHEATRARAKEAK